MVADTRAMVAGTWPFAWQATQPRHAPLLGRETVREARRQLRVARLRVRFRLGFRISVRTTEKTTGRVA